MTDGAEKAASPLRAVAFEVLADAAQDLDADLFLRPVGLLHGSAAAAAEATGLGLPFRGGPARLTAIQVFARTAEADLTATVPARELKALAGATGLWPDLRGPVSHLTEPPPSYAGLCLARPRVMGIVNVTPDSFSDGGLYHDAAAAIAHGTAMAEAGADILDIGGESTRPGADPVSPQEELDRVSPVIEGLAPLGVPISIDTRRACVMRAALAAGAALVNDVSALSGDPDSVAVVREHGVPAVLMHMRGDPRTMQDAPRYRDAALDIALYFRDRLATLTIDTGDGAIDRTRLCLDPGIGFGKTVAHNLQLIDRIGLLLALGCPVLLGASRKSFIAKLAPEAPATGRLAGSLAAMLHAYQMGVRLFRVHDVAETRQALDLAEAMNGRGPKA